ncbi:uncharacterized protein I206_106758 [Kwoniella pini CBS 10737]|uniref:Uncharacterized protein n=1 Tax=Kwoniella pini CBS 10737 TaxID=1296096 RepID=A0A1B9HTA6_9TREE|nr:uncharacterized protein I206_07354 [Kwoniella pini CBS 10737]OCF46501.1 hypothetical protein I206_07354 [Kwoniella pini CBS 10737]
MTSREGSSMHLNNNDEDTNDGPTIDGFTFKNPGEIAYEERDRSRKLLAQGQAFKNGQFQYMYGIIQTVDSINRRLEHLGDWSISGDGNDIYTSISISNKSGKIGKLVSYFNIDDLISRNDNTKEVWMNETLRNSQKNSVVFYPDSSVERYSNLVFDDPAFEDLTGFDKKTIEEKFRAPCEIIWNVVGKHSYYDESKDQSVISQS